MHNPGRDDHTHARPNRDSLIVELDLGVGFAVENVVRFGQMAVVVQLGIVLDFRSVDGPGKPRSIDEGSARGPARARDRWKPVEIDNRPTWVGAHEREF
jgi:hypothetical protein